MTDDAPTPTPDDLTPDLGVFLPVSSDDAGGISWTQFVRLGYLQELNRRFLIPLGLALEVMIDLPDEVVGVRLRGGWDPEQGPTFDVESPEVAIRALFVERAWAARQRSRVAAHGWMVQPVPEVSAEMFDRWFAGLGGTSLDVAGDPGPEEVGSDG